MKSEKVRRSGFQLRPQVGGVSLERDRETEMTKEELAMEQEVAVEDKGVETFFQVRKQLGKMRCYPGLTELG